MKLMSLPILAVVLITFLAQGVDAKAELVLVEKHKPKAAIVISEAPSEQAKQAAQLLQEYIEKISGAKLQIKSEKDNVSGNRILVGHSQAVQELGVKIPSGITYEMNEEGFVIKTIGNSLILAGNEDWNYRGTAFAVYDLLEEFGCRWFFLGSYGEVIPAMENISVGQLDRQERPSFRFRNIWFSGWMPVSGQDGKNYTEWYEHNKLGKLPGSLPGDGSIVNLAPPAKYGKSHPHIYALKKDGERTEEMLCLSEPDTVRIAVKTITDYFRSNPDAYTFGFAPPDGYPVCYCEKCQSDIPGFTGKGYGNPSLSNSWFQFVNKVAKEVYKEFPNRWLLTNGYANRVRLPETIDEFCPNIGIQSAVIQACTLHPIGDPKCWQRQLYKEFLTRWTDKLRCVFIYDYDPGKDLDNLPFPALHNLKHDLPFFKQRGVWGFWTEGHNSWMVTHLNYYVRAKLMWNVEENVDALVRDYCEKFYGKAADAVEEYIWTLEDAVNDATVHVSWGWSIPWKVVLTQKVLRKLNALMTAAQQQAQSDEAKLHVKVLKMVHEHMKAHVEMKRSVSRGDFQKGVLWADRMLEIRDEVAKVDPALLPNTPEWCSNVFGAIEWYKDLYQGVADKVGGIKGELVTMLPVRWEFKPDPEEMGVFYRWYLPGRGGRWDEIDTTLYWEAQGYQDEKGFGYTGKAWYRTGFYVPPEIKNKPLQLTISGAYNSGLWIWLNGLLVEHRKKQEWPHLSSPPFDIDVTNRIRAGEINHIAILVHTQMLQPPDNSYDARGGLHRRVFLWSPK